LLAMGVLMPSGRALPENVSLHALTDP
jgi:hypothetical protein